MQHPGQLRSHQGHQCLTLRVTETAVEFNDLGAGLRQDQPCIDDAAVVDLSPCKRSQSRFQYKALHQRKTFGIEQGGWGIGPHPTGVGPLVSLLKPLVVLGGGQQHHAIAVAERKHRDLRSLKAFLKHKLAAGRAEASLKGSADGFSCVLRGFGDRHPLACCQTIGLHHQRSLNLLKHGHRLSFRAHRPMACCGHSRFAHQRFCPGLACFQLGTIGTGAEHRQPRCSQLICQAFSQRGFRAHHHKFNPMGAAGLDQAIAIGLGHAQPVTATEFVRAAIARRNPDVLDPIGAFECPGESILATTPADDEDPMQGGKALRTGCGHGHRSKSGTRKPPRFVWAGDRMTDPWPRSIFVERLIPWGFTPCPYPCRCCCWPQQSGRLRLPCSRVPSPRLISRSLN